MSISITKKKLLTKIRLFQKPKIAILGAGWAGFNLAKKISKKDYDVTVISPRNYFLFTPLLTTTTVGTLEYQSIIRPVRTIPNLKFVQASCDSIDTDKNTITSKCEFSGKTITTKYDGLVIATGAQYNSFGVKGVEENALHLKQVSDAKAIRNRLTEVFEMASNPELTSDEKKNLLSIVVVGGGPTSIEFIGELSDFISRDLPRMYPSLQHYLKIHLVELNKEILMAFPKSARDYASEIFTNRNIKIHTNSSCKEVKKDSVVFSDGTVLPTRTVVWNTGNKQVPFIQSLGLMKKKPCGRLSVDKFCRVKTKSGKVVQNVFALGDCSTNPESPLPPTAQVASQQAKWLIKFFNDDDYSRKFYEPFEYKNKGAMAYIGNKKAIIAMDDISFKGRFVWVIWNLVYLKQLPSFKNRILVPTNWISSYFFRRHLVKFT